MKIKVLLGALAVASLLTAACSSAPPANTNTATTNSNTATTTTTTTTTASPSPASTTATSNTSQTEGGKQDFTVVNATGVEIDKLYVSPHDKDDWEEDILGRDTLPNNESVDIKFGRDEKAAMWDLRIEDKSGNAIEWQNLNLLEISKVTLHYDPKDKRAWADVQ